MKPAIFAPMFALLLASCTAAKFEQMTLSIVAPDVIEYPKDKQESAAQEVEHGSCPVLTEFAQDYCVMRDQSRILKGQKPLCTVVTK